MKKKYILIIALLFGFTLILVNILYVNGNLDYFKNKIPATYKEKLKSTIFYFTHLKKTNQVLSEYINEINLRNQKIEAQINKISQEKNLANENIFPQTHFLKLRYDSKNLETINLEKKPLYVGSEEVSPHYLEYSGDNLFIASKSGAMYQILISSLYNENLEFTKINTNLDSNIEVTDTLIVKDKLYIVFHRKDRDCKNISIYETKLEPKSINFEFKKFFEFGELGNCERYAFAGRIANYEINNQDGLLLSSVSFKDQNKEILDQYGIRLEYKFSDIIFISFKEKKYKKLATGFKNPQGLIVINNNIIASDHGPRGGDEINNIKPDKHYGYPYSSYGENYYKSLKEEEKFEFFKTHSDKGFEEPIFSWVPSIAPSQLLVIDRNFSKKWGKTVLLSSLKGRSLFRLSFDKDFNKLITYERIRINKRIRDLIYIPNQKMIILAQESENGSLGIITNQ
jgi:hypothetical protein